MYDVIVIGAGVTGLGAAWHLTEFMNKNVLLLEQFPFPNQFGSSAGHSRITRELYAQTFNCVLMKEAHELWRCLEKKTGKQLFIKSGLLSYGTDSVLKNQLNAIKESKIEPKVINAEECAKLFPLFTFPTDFKVILDPNAGVLRADRCLAALMERCIACGLEFHEMEKVEDIESLNNSCMKVKTNNGEYLSKSVVVSTGTWSWKLLKNFNVDIPLYPQKVHYGYFRPLKDSGVDFNYSTIPSFFETHDHVYGMCGNEYPGCLKIGDFNSDLIDPDLRDSNDPKSCDSKDRFLNNVTKHLALHIPSADLNPVQIHTCVITKTPDLIGIIDRHPKYPNLIIGTGFSGAGFKTGVIHGKFLALLATNTDHKYDLSSFKLARFNQFPKL